MISGAVKAISVRTFIMAISFIALTIFMVYAAATTSMGYVIKKALYKLANRINEL